MISRTSERFWKCDNALPEDVKKKLEEPIANVE